MKTEEWRAIAGYEESYEVSSLGRVRSLDRVLPIRIGTALRRGIVLRQTPDKRGYLGVNLSQDNKQATRKVHRLVAEAFLGAPPAPEAPVNHLDFVKSNNAMTNLEWCSRSENFSHARAFGRFDGSISPKRGKKITAAIASNIREASDSGEPRMSIAKRNGLSRRTVDRIITGRIWVRAENVMPQPLPACASAPTNGMPSTNQLDA